MVPPRRGSRRSKGRARKELSRSEPTATVGLPYTRRNAWVFAAGIAVIGLGYFCLAQPPVDGPLSLSVAPILLVLGYCVIIPIALLLGSPDEGETGSESGTTPSTEDERR